LRRPRLEAVGIDFAAASNATRSGVPASRDGRSSVLEVGGKRMSQSGAILMCWRRPGHFAPARRRHEALRWILFDNHKFTNNHAIHRFQKSFTPSRRTGVLAFMRTRAESFIRDRGQASR